MGKEGGVKSLLKYSKNVAEQEHYQLKRYSHLLIDESGDPLNSSSPGQPPDGGLGDALDIVPQHLPVPLGSPLTQPLPSLPAPMSVSAHSVQVFSQHSSKSYWVRLKNHSQF